MQKGITLLFLVSIFSCKDTTHHQDQIEEHKASNLPRKSEPYGFYAESFSVSPMQKSGIFVLNLEYDSGKKFSDTIEIYYDDKNTTAELYKEIADHHPSDFILTTGSQGVMNITTNRVMKNHYWYNDSMQHVIYLADGPVKNYHPD